MAEWDGVILPQTHVAQVLLKLTAAIWGRQIKSLFPVFAERICVYCSSRLQFAFIRLIKMDEG